METKIPRLVIAATQSGSGKTTIVTGILAALRARGMKVQSYKVGPDYIDPGYHKLASGRNAHNLDSWLVGENKISDIFVTSSKGADIAIIEGVMGLYDGGSNGISSTAEIAKKLQAPVLLVIDAKSMGDSAAAIALGFKMYDKDVNIAGVILNRLGSNSHEQLISEALERLDIRLYGAVRRNNNLHMPERHLGLLPTTENDAMSTVKLIGDNIAAQTDIDGMVKLALQAPPITSGFYDKLCKGRSIRIAVADDEAFSFYYPESMAVLEGLGAELVRFSPLNDKILPENIAGIILGGGFPEIFAARLAENTTMRDSIRAAAAQHMPIYAECGGFMYLTQAIYDFAGQSYSMVGLIPAECRMEDKLQTVGYVEAEANCDNIFMKAGAKLRGHEFHFSVMAQFDEKKFPWAFTFEKKRTRSVYPAGYAKDNILASYLHIHFAGNVPAAENFLASCRAFQGEDDE